jgi:hypothetical protein
MEPQVNKILSRLGKAEKTELKSERFELANIGKYESESYGADLYSDQLSQWADKIDKLKQELERTLDNASFVYKTAEKEIKKVISQESSIEKAIKDLGLSEPANYQKAKKRIRQIQSDVEKFGKKIKA